MNTHYSDHLSKPTSVLFVPHGSPLFALQPGAAGAALRRLGSLQPMPRALVVVSPHWETAIATVGSSEQMETIHDFGNFDPRLFEIQYPASGNPSLAQGVASALRAAGLPANMDKHRGLDHGAWVPLRHLYPHANIPVVPLSIQHAGGPQHAYRVGQALAPLAKQGVLIVASGNVTHNLQDWQRVSHFGMETPSYVQQFADWVHAQITKGELDALLNYRGADNGGIRAHPRDEHLLPLFTALGAAGPDARPQAFHRGISDHVIAMDGYTFPETHAA